MQLFNSQFLTPFYFSPANQGRSNQTRRYILIQQSNLLPARRTSQIMSKSIRYIIQTSKGPKPVGPYNQAVRANNVVYLSGVIGLDPKTNQIVPGGVENETKQIFRNMEAVLKAAGSSLDKIVKASVFLNDINDFGKVNEIYKQFIVKDHPARSAYQVGKLPVGALVEIEAIALCGDVETQYITE